MKRTAFGLTVAMLMSITVAAMAAGPPFERDGSDYDGSIPRDCPVFEVEGSSLHVECTSSDVRSDNARIRFRFLNDYGIRRGPATVSADIETLSSGGECARVRWMENPRTLRILVPTDRPRCEVLIHTATLVSQP